MNIRSHYSATWLGVLLVPALCCTVIASADEAKKSGCRLVGPQVHLCQSGVAAAIAFERQVAGMNDSAEALLVRSGCRQAGADLQDSPVQVIAHGPVAVPGGQREVFSIRISSSGYWYVAAPDLGAACRSPK